MFNVIINYDDSDDDEIYSDDDDEIYSDLMMMDAMFLPIKSLWYLVR
jgi:hypothetical protein